MLNVQNLSILQREMLACFAVGNASGGEGKQAPGNAQQISNPIGHCLHSGALPIPTQMHRCSGPDELLLSPVMGATGAPPPGGGLPASGGCAEHNRQHGTQDGKSECASTHKTGQSTLRTPHTIHPQQTRRCNTAGPHRHAYRVYARPRELQNSDTITFSPDVEAIELADDPAAVRWRPVERFAPLSGGARRPSTSPQQCAALSMLFLRRAHAFTHASLLEHAHIMLTAVSDALCSPNILFLAGRDMS
jgi:hypothetical protein